MDRLNLVEKLRTKTGITYEDAKMVLEINNWDILDAILDLERQGKIKGPSVSIFYTNEYNENYEYALSYANSLIKSKTNSNEMLKYKIKVNLLNKGFSYSVIDYALENVTFNEEQINLKKDLEKVLKKYPNDCYKVISKLAIKGYNVNEIKKALKEEGVFDED